MTKDDIIDKLTKADIDFDPKLKKAELEALLPADADHITAKELATIFDTDAKSLRRWLRSISSETPGKGKRWIFSPDTVNTLTALWAERKAKGTEPELADAEAPEATAT